MKKISILFFILLFQLVPINMFSKSRTGNLKIYVSGFKTCNGQLILALCNSESNYKDHKNPYKGGKALIINKTSQFVFRNLPYGTYAIKAFHDKNKDNKLNFALLGWPVEAYGFSNNARRTFGPPSWKAAKFTFFRNNQTITFKVK